MEDLEGIFRMAAQADDVNALRTAFDNGEYVDLTKADPYAVAEVIKLYFKLLPQPLFPFQLFKDIAAVPDINNEEQQLEKLSSLLKDLPSSNYHLLQFIIDFLHKLSFHSQKTKMNSSNLAMLFGPNLIRPPLHESAIFVFNRINHVLELIIDHYPKLFPCISEISPIGEVSQT